MISNQAHNRALATISVASIAAVFMTETLSAQTAAGKWSLCGAGKYDFSAGGQPLGSETFEITCKPDGHYTATGRTQLSGARERST